MSAPQSPRAKIEFLVSHPRFHQCLTLSATSDHPELQVKYTVVGKGTDDVSLGESTGQNGEGSSKIPTIIAATGMMASRYIGVAYHHLAVREGVRIVWVDRPGIGGSTEVPLNQRIPVWLETVPALMKVLGVKHVVLASHSNGTMYLMNSLWHLRDVLSPTRPYVMFFAPWVHPLQSSSTLLSLATHIPSSLVSRLTDVMSFVNAAIAPPVAASSTVFSAVRNPIMSAFSRKSAIDPAQFEAKKASAYGLDEKEREALNKVIFEKIMSENRAGVNDEALLCLKKGKGKEPAPSWRAAEDYEGFVKGLAKREKERAEQRRREDGQLEPSASKLKVDITFSESDIMIGKGGEKYFRNCWTGTSEVSQHGRNEDVAPKDSDEGPQEALNTAAAPTTYSIYGDVFELGTQVIKGTDHDSVIECWRSSWDTLFEGTRWSLADEDH